MLRSIGGRMVERGLGVESTVVFNSTLPVRDYKNKLVNKIKMKYKDNI